MGTIIFLSFILIFLSVMLRIDVNLIVDTKSMKLILFVKIYQITVVRLKLSLLSLVYKLNGRKPKKLNLVLKKEEKYFISQIKSNIINKLYYDNVFINSEINVGDSAITAQIIGILNLCAEITDFILKSQNEDMEFYYNFYSNFRKYYNKLQIGMRVYFTIFDMMYSVVLSLYRRGKYVKEKR